MVSPTRLRHDASNPKGSRFRTVVRTRRLVFGAVIGFGVALAACGGGSAIDLSPVATKVQVAQNGFSFPNFPATAYKDEFDASDVTNMFGSGPAVCVSGRGESCELTAEAAAFARMVNQSRASGHCEGLAAVALTRFDTSADPPTVKLPDQDETIHTIMRAFATQFVPEAQADVEKWLSKSLDEKISALVETFKTGKLDYTLGLYIPEGGHALLPYAVEFPSKDNARIMVYDTNWPGKNRYVDVDLKAKKWRFSFSGEDPENDPNEWTGGPADMDLTAFETRNGTCPFCGDGTKTSTTTMLVRTTNLDWSVEANGQTLKPGGVVTPGSGVVVKPVKGLNFPGSGLFSATNSRSAYDYLIRIPNEPAKAGQKKTRSKLKFSGTTSLFAVTPTGIAQVNTPGNPNIPVEVGETSIVSKDPAVQLTLASGNLVASASGPGAVLETSASGTVEVTVTTSTGQVVKQEVTPDAPAAKVTADATGGVTALVAAASGEVLKREVSATGVETKTVTTETLDLNTTSFKAPAGLESKPIEALPALDKRNLANPDYKADEPYVAPTTTTTISAKNKAIEPTKATISKFIIDPAVFGDSPFTLTEPTSNSTADFTYSSSDPSVATVGATTGKVTIVGAGTTMITASQEATTGFTSASITTPFKVAKAATKIATVTLPKKTFGDDPFVVKPPSSNSTADFVFDSSNELVAKIGATTGKVTIVGAGSTTISFSQPASANYEAATSKATLTVSKASLTFASAVLDDVVYGTADFSLTPPTSSSNGVITYSTTTPDVATVDAVTGRVKIVGVGAASLRVSQAATTNFESSVQTISFSVKRARPTLALASQSDKPFGSPDFTLAAPITNSTGAISYSSVTPSVATINSSTGLIHLVGTGTVTIQVSVAATNNYESRSETVSFVARKALPTYGNFAISSIVATAGTLQVPAVTSTSSSPFTYSSSDANVATINANGLISIVSAGTTNITVSQVGNALFEAGSVSTSFTITRATAVFGQFFIPAKTYGDSPFAVTPPVSTSAGAFSFTSSNSAVATVTPDGSVTIVGAGTSVITATQAATGIYNSGYTVGTLAVAKATPVYGPFSFADHDADGATIVATVPTSTSPAPFTYASSNTAVATVNATTGAVTVVAPGTTIITASQAATTNFTGSSVSAPLTVLSPSPTLGPLTATATTETPGLIGTRYVGFYNDDPFWFATATPHGDTNVMTNFQSFNSPNSDYYSWEWTGAFKASVSGTYHFCTTSDDDSFIWFGTYALTRSALSNATVQNPGQHGMSERCGDITFTGGTTYPMRMVFGDGCCGDGLEVYFTINGGNRIYDGAGYYVSQQPSRVGDANYTVAHPSSNSSGAFTYTSSNPAVATINSVTGEVSILTAGITTFTATQAATNNYRSASVSSTVTFEKGLQTNLTALPSTCATGGTCAVGDIGPGGGTVIYAPSTPFTSAADCGSTCNYLEVAPVNWNGASSDANNNFTWDCAGTLLSSTSTGIGAGYANTVAMATNCPQTTAAATIVRKLTWGNQNDWYIPSSEESAIMYGQRSLIANWSTTGSYWTSTEVSATTAFRQQQSTLTSTVKTSNGIIRPIRAFKSNGLAVPFIDTSVTLVPSGGSGTGARSIQLVSAGSASCTFDTSTNVLTAAMSGTCKIKVLRAGDANWQEGVSSNLEVSFYGPPLTSVSVGVYDTCGININGGVSCWGHGDWGLLGDGLRQSSTSPVTVSGLTSGVTSLAAGQHHNCALLTDGSVKCWGYGDNGQLGNGTTGQYSTPIDATALNFKAKQIVAGHQHTCALTVTGGVKCWGWNGYGQLGDGTYDNKFTPVDVIGLTSGVTQISANFGGTCAVLENNNLKCWGRNDYGQIGDGTNTNRSVPVTVTALNGTVKSVASGVFGTCAITLSNTLMCWGHNGWGDLGNGNNSSSTVPIAVPSLNNVAKVVMGEGHVCALTFSGSLKCWGRNEAGELGDGTQTNRNTPVSPIEINGVVTDVSAGIFMHTCAIIDGGTVKCWGKNDWGQLGDGTTITRSTPIKVLRMRGSHQTATTLGALNLPTGVIDVNTAPFTIAAPSANRAGTITFTSSNPSVATINAVTGQVNVVAAGQTSISAVMGGTGEYSVGSAVVQLKVRPLNPQSLSACQLALSCNVGDIGPAGGRIVYVDTNDVYPGIDYLEAAPADTASDQWCDANHSGNYTYGPQVTGIGMYNMQSALAMCSSGASRLAAAYTKNGYADWYLPTLTEMQYVISAFTSATNVNNAIAPLAASTAYWTSNEVSGTHVLAVNSGTNGSTADPKTAVHNIRPIRAFISLYSPKITTALTGYSLGTSSYEFAHPPFDVQRPTSLSAGLVRFTSSATAIASVHEFAGTVTNNFVGNVTFTATQSAWAGFVGSTMTANYQVVASTPAITGFGIPAGTFNSRSAAFAVTTPASPSPGAFTYSSNNTAVATVDATSGIVTIVGSGQAVITVTQAAVDPWTSSTSTALLNVAKACADGGACVLGDTGPGGGKIFFVSSAKQSWGRYLEAAPADLSTMYAWCNNGSQDTLGARALTIGTGQSNTTAIIGSCTSGAANAADAFTVNGASDWYLPSLDELTQMYNNKALVGQFDTTIAYWTSSEDSTSAAKTILFGTGAVGANTKLASYKVRPIRSVEGPADGLTAATAGTSASQLMVDNGYTGTGNYFIKPQGYTGNAVQLWCDFTHLGGGWALIGKGRQSNDYTGGWFGTENELNTSGLMQANAAGPGISKVSSEFVNYLMNGTANGWVNANSNNYLIANRIATATDGLGGVGDSWKIKITNQTQFKWIRQFGDATVNTQASTGTGIVQRWDALWLGGNRNYDWVDVRVNDLGENDARRLFTWHWDGHGDYHGWSAGSSENRGFMNGSEAHPIQFVQLWAR